MSCIAYVKYRLVKAHLESGGDGGEIEHETFTGPIG